MEKLPTFLYKQVKEHNTSLGNNKAFPSTEDYPFDYTLLKQRYSQVISDVKTMYDKVPSIDEAKNELSKVVKEILEHEKPLQAQLEKLCINLVNKSLGVPRETVNLTCSFVTKVIAKFRVLPEGDEEDGYTFDDVEQAEFMNGEIMKRRMVNALIQGAAYDLMLQNITSDEYYDKISEWDEELPILYFKQIALSNFLLFAEQARISDKKPMQGAFVNTHLGNGDDRTTIDVIALDFPLMLQEAFRGFFELFGSHGLPDETEKAMHIMKKADFLIAEPWDTRLGVTLWKLLTRNVEADTTLYPYLFSSIVQLDVDEFNSTLKNIFIGTKKGKKYICNVISQVKHDREYQEFKNAIQQMDLDKSLIVDSELVEEDAQNCSKNIIELAIEEFGTTSILSEAGYILPDGKLLNFGEQGQRTTDHRAIDGIYIGNGINIVDDSFRYNYVVDFMNRGAIRIDANIGAINMVHEPTTAQYIVLKEIVRGTNGEAYVDFTNSSGNTLYSVEYEHVTPQRLVADIHKYYTEELKSQGDVQI